MNAPLATLVAGLYVARRRFGAQGRAAWSMNQLRDARFQFACLNRHWPDERCFRRDDALIGSFRQARAAK
jgi:hypothetical protein